MFARFIFLTVFLMMALARPAVAQEYASPSWENLVKTMVRFNALNITDPALLDEFAIITECDLYQTFYHDDFKWNKVRQAIVQSVKANVAIYPMNYHYDATLRLDRYDFDKKLFRFSDMTVLRNVNTFMIYSVEGTQCGAADVKLMPRIYRAVLADPVNLEGIALAEQDARTLLADMQKSHNDHRVIRARFNLRIVYIEPLRKEGQDSIGKTAAKYKQSNAGKDESVRLDARLDSIDFFDDQDMTHSVYRYEP